MLYDGEGVGFFFRGFKCSPFFFRSFSVIVVLIVLTTHDHGYGHAIEVLCVFLEYCRCLEESPCTLLWIKMFLFLCDIIVRGFECVVRRCVTF